MRESVWVQAVTHAHVMGEMLYGFILPSRVTYLHTAFVYVECTMQFYEADQVRIFIRVASVEVTNINIHYYLAYSQEIMKIGLYFRLKGVNFAKSFLSECSYKYKPKSQIYINVK